MSQPVNESADASPVGGGEPAPTGASAGTHGVADADGHVPAGPEVAVAQLTEFPPDELAAGATGNLDLLRDIEVSITVELGRAHLRVEDVLQLRAGSVVELSRPIGSPVDLLANGRIIARGQIVVVEDQLGVRVTEFAASSAGG